MEELKKQEQEELKKTETTKPEASSEMIEPVKKDAEPKKSSDYKFANKVPGKEGFVFSPYNNKVVDVRDIPSGTWCRIPPIRPPRKNTSAFPENLLIPGKPISGKPTGSGPLDPVFFE